MPRLDAIWLPESIKRGARLIDRIAAVAAVAEPLLEVDRTVGERAYIRKQPHGRLLSPATRSIRSSFQSVTRSPACHDTGGSGGRTGLRWDS